MPRRMVATALALLVLLPAAASAEDADAETDAFIRRCVGLIADGEFESARGCFELGTLERADPDALEQAHDALQLGGTLEISLLEPKMTLVAGDESIDRWVYHALGSEGGSLFTASTHQTPTGPALVGLQWELVPLDLRDRYPFTLVGMPWFAYVFLILAILIPLYMVHTAVICFRRQPSFLWLWIAFILVGVGRLSMIWRPSTELTNGVTFAPVTISILGVGLSKWPDYTPWVLWISLPVGALIFRWYTRNWDEPYVEAGTPSPPVERSDG